MVCCRWTMQDSPDPHRPELCYPKEERDNAKMRAGLFWRWLAEREETRVAVFTHSKLIKQGEGIWMLGEGIEEVPNGQPMIVRIDI